MTRRAVRVSRDFRANRDSGRVAVMLLDERKQGVRPHPAESRSKTRPIRTRREFCLFVQAGVSVLLPSPWVIAILAILVTWIALGSGLAVNTMFPCPR